MQNYKSYLLYAGVLAAAVLVGSVIGWLGGAGYADNPTPTPVADIATPLAETPAPPPTVVSKPAAPVVAVAVVHQTPGTQASVAATNWEEAVQAILDADIEDAEKAKQLFALFPKLPPDEQVTVVENLATLVPDENYAPMGKLLTDARLPAPVLDALMDNAQTRANALLLPLMLELAQNPAHPKAAEARDTLKTYLDHDYGTDWVQWQQQITAWLKDNPD